MPKHYHNQQLKNAIIAHWQNGMSYENIVNTINASMKDHFGLEILQIMFMKCEIMEAAVMQSENG
jgi:hypothetical protein